MLKKHFHFEIPGTPIALARPRFSKNVTFNCQRPEMNALAWHFREAHGSPKPLEGPVKLEVAFYFQMPKVMLKKYNRDPDAFQDWEHTKRPDLSNLIKFVEDSLNGIAYHDDAQICCIESNKYYDPEEPRTIISIYAL